jgi:hypothetical protein
MATTRAILQVLENFQKARIIFVQTCAELATKPQVNFPVFHKIMSFCQLVFCSSSSSWDIQEVPRIVEADSFLTC